MTTATATFHQFPELPYELRARIWGLTVEPRIVEVRVVHHVPKPLEDQVSEPGAWTKEKLDRSQPPMRHLRSPTAAPPQLQACREARKHLSEHPRYRYEKAFQEIAVTPYDGFGPVPAGDPQRERYVWLNFDIDMVSIGDTGLCDFRSVAYQVRRLRLTRSLNCDFFCDTESELIGKLFKNLSEIYVVCLEGMRSGYTVTEVIYFPCGPQNLYFADPETIGGMMMNSVDLDDMMIREFEEILRKIGFKKDSNNGEI